MRRFLVALALFLAATLLAAVCGRQETKPATTATINVSWKRICAGGFELLATFADANRAYLVAPDIIPLNERPRVLQLDLPLFLAQGRPPRAVPVRTCDIHVDSGLGAFGVSQDTVPLRVALTPDGPIPFLHPDGVPRQISCTQDRTKIVFNDRGHNGLWLTDVAGSTVVRLCPQPAESAVQASVIEAARRANTGEGWSFHWATEPLWSPDDRFVLYCSTRSACAEAATGIWLLDPRDRRETLLLDGKEFGFLKPVGWCSPTCLVLQAGDLSVKLLDIATGSVETLATNALALASCSRTGLVALRKIPPAGRAVASPEVWLTGPGFSPPKILGAAPEPYTMSATGSWSPDGARFAFFAHRAGEPADTALVLAEARNPGRVALLSPPAAAFAKSTVPQWVTPDTIICRLVPRAGTGTGEESTWLLRLNAR